MKIKGISAAVTGGAQGLGEAVARALAAGGAKVAILDLNEEKAQSVAKEIGGVAMKCNVTDPDGAAAALKAAGDAHGVPRILMNCAGIATAARIVGKSGPQDLRAYSQVIQVNLIGTFNMMRLAAADMMKLEPLETQERGIVINTSSIAAYDGQIGQAAYASSKGGIVSLTLPAAREFARFGIRVMAIAPGIFLTPLFDTLSPEAQESLSNMSPFPKRLGKPEEFASLVLHTIDNEMLNGEVIRLDAAIRMSA